MSKIRKISFPQSAEVLEFVRLDFSAYWDAFLASELGQIYQALPWVELIQTFKLTSKPLGRKSIFSPQGKLALMFLKNYCCCSDQRLLNQLNGNLDYQFFCGILIPPDERLAHRQLVSSIRGELANLLSIEKVQQVLASNWKPFIKDSETVLVDATCYESEVRYPTDIKLLFESIIWLYWILKSIHKKLHFRMPRTKYKKWIRRYESYRRMRKPRVKSRKRMKGGFIRLLEKLIGILEEIEMNHPQAIELKDLHRIKTIKKVYKQQYQLFLTGESPKNRIISLAKDYLRPIVRGKEKKPVEFGAKVNKIQIGGINFIEHLDFEAFHEGNRLEFSIFRARKLTGKVSRLGADAIYATNANRTYCRKQKIFTDFVRKGRAGKFEDQNKVLRKAIKKERATRLEGSFGNEKNAYHLRKVRARTRKNEILWIFCGIHTANAVEIGKRMTQAKLDKAA